MEPRSTPEILAFGEGLAELQRTGDGETVRGAGGDTSNFCIAAARSGAHVGYISAVGDDAYGRLLRETWVREGVDDRHVLTEPLAPTGAYVVSHDASGHHFEYRRTGSAASLYHTRDLPRGAIADATILHLSGISLAVGRAPAEAGLAALAHARRNGVLTSFDTNLRLSLCPIERARALAHEALALTDIGLPSWDDAVALFGGHDPDEIVEAVLDTGPTLVVLKMGAEGCYVATGAVRKHIPAHPVQAVDATGAGDCFAGALIARLVAGDPPEQAAHYANVAAALSTRGYGAVAPIPTAAQIRAAI